MLENSRRTEAVGLGDALARQNQFQPLPAVFDVLMLKIVKTVKRIRD
jgi:hypothetical protein